MRPSYGFQYGREPSSNALANSSVSESPADKSSEFFRRILSLSLIRKSLLCIAIVSSACASAQGATPDLCPTREPAAAIAACTAIIQSGNAKPSDLAHAYFHRALAYQIQRRHDLTIADLTKAIRLRPGRMHRLFASLGRRLRFRHEAPLGPGQFDVVDAYWQRGGAYGAMGQYDLAIRDLTRAIRLRPREAGLWNDRGTEYWKTGRIARALADYSKAIDLNPDSDSAFCNRANAYYSAGQYELAIVDYTESLRLNADDASTLNSRGNAYMDTQQFDRAITDFDAALRMSPNDSGLFNNRAIAWSRKHELDRAIADLNEAIHIKPDYAEAFNTRGVQYMGKGMYEDALRDFQQSVRLVSGNPVAIVHRAAAYGMLGQHSEALAGYSEALRLSSWTNHPYVRGESLNGICWERAIMGELDQAISACNESLNGFPNDPSLDDVRARTFDSRGFIYLKMGKYDSAITDLDSALKINRDLASSWYARGLAKQRMGDAAGGAADIAKAERIDEDIKAEFAKLGISALDPTQK